MRLIDGHILMERLQEQTEEVASPVVAAGLLMAQRIVLKAPTIDAEQVVRCIDCIFWYDCEYTFKSENGFCCCGAKMDGDSKVR